MRAITNTVTTKPITVLEALLKPGPSSIAHGGEVVDRPRHQVTDLALLEVGQLQPLEVREDRRSAARTRSGASHPVVGEAGAEVEHPLEQRHAYDQPGGVQQHRSCPARMQRVDGPPEHVRPQQRSCVGGDEQQQAKN